MSTRAAPEFAPATPARRAFTPAPRALVQRDAASSAAVPATAPESVHRALSSAGRPLDPATRNYMENRFGHDFSQVRVHTDSRAADSARDLHAHAYTVGSDIAFAAGRYQPETESGRQLLAHELAHTIQQQGLQRRASDLAVDTAPDSRLEHEAESAARAVASGFSAPAIAARAPGPVVSRAGKPPVKSAASVTINTDVTILGALAHDVEPDGPVPGPSGAPRVRKFKVSPFYLPGSKGEGADARYTEYITAGQLRTVVGFNDSGQPRTELWQSRDRTEVLGESWLQLVGWSSTEKDDKWKAVTGEAHPFPKVGSKGESAQIDHIVELQLGGTNNPANLRPLDAEPNGESGRLIWEEVSKLAKGVKDEPSFKVGKDDQIELRFTDMKPKGTVWSGDHTKAPMNALKAHNKAMASRTAPAADSTVKYIRLTAGANTDDFAVPADWGSKNKAADLSLLPFNKAPAQLISSLQLKTVNYVAPTLISVDAEFDLRNRTRIPLSTKADAAASGNKPFKLAGNKSKATDPAFKLTLPKAPAGLGFDYPYLSPVTLDSVKLNDSGDLDWKGTLKSSVPLLNPIGLEYKQGELYVVKGIDPETLKKKKLLGFSITEAAVKLKLAPKFELEAGVKFRMGDEASPLVKGDLSLKPDSLGVTGEGNIEVNLPKVKSAASKITYKGGGGRDDWTVKLSVKSEDITLAPGYTITGQLDAMIEKGELKFAGQLDATLPGGNTAKLGLRRSPHGKWQLFGGGTFKIPKINQVQVDATYDLGTETLTATVATKTGFKIPVVDFTGNLDRLTITVNKEGKLWVTGAGSLEFERGKAKGKITVDLHEGGWFSGTGNVSYKLRDDLTLSGGVAFTERPKPPEPRLRVTGELKLEKFHLFDAKGSSKDLVKVGVTIPIPGLSAGTSGLVINVAGKLTIGYSFGPGVIAPLIFKAGFNPLDDASDLELGVEGTVKIPASAYLRAAVSAELAAQVDAYIAKGGVAAGLELSGRVELKGEAFADLKASYKEKKLKADVTAGVRADLDLGFALTAYVRAYASSIIGLDAEERIDWVLAAKSLPTGAKLELSAPFGYASDTGFTFPELKDIKVVYPEIDAKKTIKDLWDRGGSGNKSAAK